MFSSLRTSAIRAAAAGARKFSSGGGGGGGGGGMATPLALAALGGAGYVYYDTQQQLEAVSAKVDSLQVALSGKTNSAFVFIKPHACKGTPGAVEKVLEGKFKESGIRILESGEKLADEIDKGMLIDTHYGAIANKAVKVKPSELNVPDKGKKDFQTIFGESWESAIAAGKVYNAKDGAAKLGLTSEQLNDEWSKLSVGKTLIKFGGGFYCGKVKDIYIMNGFYMSMRAGECEMSNAPSLASNNRPPPPLSEKIISCHVVVVTAILFPNQQNCMSNLFFFSLSLPLSHSILQPRREDQVVHCILACRFVVVGRFPW